MLVVSWNVKGLGCPHKRSHILDFHKMYCGHYSDPRNKNCSSFRSFFRSIGGLFIIGWSHLSSIRASGRQFIGWRDNIFECTSVGEFCFQLDYLIAGLDRSLSSHLFIGFVQRDVELIFGKNFRVLEVGWQGLG